MKPDVDGKAFATFKARLALRGWGVTTLTDDHGAVEFVAFRWTHARVIPDLEGLLQLALLLETGTKGVQP